MAKNVYLSGTGNNANDGLSAGAPKATYAGTNGAKSILERGDTLKLIGTINEVLTFDQAVSGTTQIIVDSNDHGNMAIIDGDYILPPDNGGGNTSVNGVRALWTPLVNIKTSYITVQYIKVMESQGRGFVVAGVTGARISNVTIDHCEIGPTRLNCIAVQEANYVTISSCTIHDGNNYFSTPGDSPAPGSTWGAMCNCSYASNITYTDNDIYHGWGEGVVFQWGTENCTVSYNRIRNTNSGKIYMDRSRNATVIGNILWDSLDASVLRRTQPSTGLSVRNEVRSGKPSALPVDNVLFANNIIIGCSYGITFGGTQQSQPDLTNNVRVYHNMFINCRNNPDAVTPGGIASINIKSDSNYTNCIFKNNICYQTDNKFFNNSVAITGITFDGNGFSSSSANVTETRRSPKDNYNVVLTAPHLNLIEASLDETDFEPSVSYLAEAIAEVTTDFYGDARVGNWMGALGDAGDPPPPPDGGVSANLYAGIVQALLDTTAGDVTATDTLLSGNTPESLLAFATNATVANTSVDNWKFSIGAADATYQNVMSSRAQDNQAASVTGSIGATDMVTMTRASGGATVVHESSRKNFITNGVTLNKAATMTESAGMIGALFGGEDFQCKTGTFAVASALNSTASIELPFKYNLLIVWAGSGPPDDSAYTFINQNIGISTDVSDQYCLTNYAVQNANPTDNRARMASGVIAYRVDNSQTLRVTSNDASGFDVINEGATGARTYGYFAAEFAGVRTWVGTDTTPTSATTKQHLIGASGNRFKPSLIIAVASLIDTINTTKTDSQAGSFCIGLWQSDKAYCVGASNQDNVTPSQTKSIYDTKALNILQHDGTAGIIATVSSFDTDGVTLSYSAALASARLMILFGVEEVIPPVVKRQKIRNIGQGLKMGMRLGF